MVLGQKTWDLSYILLIPFAGFITLLSVLLYTYGKRWLLVNYNIIFLDMLRDFLNIAYVCSFACTGASVILVTYISCTNTSMFFNLIQRFFIWKTYAETSS